MIDFVPMSLGVKPKASSPIAAAMKRGWRSTCYWLKVLRLFELSAWVQIGASFLESGLLRRVRIKDDNWRAELRIGSCVFSWVILSSFFSSTKHNASQTKYYCFVFSKCFLELARFHCVEESYLHYPWNWKLWIWRGSIKHNPMKGRVEASLLAR